MKLSELIENLICLEELEKEKKRENGAPTSKTFKDYTVYIALNGKCYELYNKEGSIGVCRFYEPNPKTSVLMDRYRLVDFGFIDDLEAPKESVKVGEVHTLELRTDGKSTKIDDITIEKQIGLSKAVKIKCLNSNCGYEMVIAHSNGIVPYMNYKCPCCGSAMSEDFSHSREGIEKVLEEFENSKVMPISEIPKTLKELEFEAKEHDVVNNPSHYKRGEIECYEALKASMTKEQFLGHLKATAIAYLWRYDLKNGLEDVKKAKWYVDQMVKEMEGE